MTAKTDEVIEDKAEPDEAERQCDSANLASGAGFSPNDPLYLRQTALHVAAGLRAPGHTRAAEVLSDAQAFFAFLKGE